MAQGTVSAYPVGIATKNETAGGITEQAKQVYALARAVSDRLMAIEGAVHPPTPTNGGVSPEADPQHVVLALEAAAQRLRSVLDRMDELIRAL